MYTVRVTFSGLCAFVPSDETDFPEWVGVFLVDADERSRQRFGIDLPPHYPFIRFKWSDLQGQADPPVGDDRAIWSLQDKDVVIATGNNSPRGVRIRRCVGSEPGPVPEPKNDPIQESLFDWVSCLDEAQPGAGVLHPECFSPNPAERVSVRVHLTEGELMSSGIGQFDDDYVLSKFEPPIPLDDGPAAPRPVRAFAREVVLEIREVSGPISVRARQFGAAEFHKLDFKAPPEGGSLEIEILDLCLSDLVDDSGRETAVPRIYPRRDQDYLWYYILTDQFGIFPIDKRLPVPLPVQFRLRDPNEVGGGEPAQCTGTVTKPPTTAQFEGMRDLAVAISAG